MGESTTTPNPGIGLPPLSTAILTDDVNLCAMLQHTLAMSRNPHFSSSVISPDQCSAGTFLAHDIVFLDRMYRARPYAQTLQEFLPAAQQAGGKIILLLDEYELANDLPAIASAIKAGVDELALRSDLSLNHIVRLIREQPGTASGLAGATSRAPYSASSAAIVAGAAPLHAGTSAASTARPAPATPASCYQHQLAIDLESQRIHIQAIENSPLFNATDTLLSLPEWQAKLDKQGGARFAELLQSAVEYKTIPRSIDCLISCSEGSPIAATISDIQIKNNGQGRVVGASAELNVESLSAQTATPFAPTHAGFDNLGDSSEVLANDNNWENVARSLPMMCLLLDENGYIASIVNNEEHLNQHFPSAQPGRRLSEILDIESLDSLVETIQRTLNTGKEHQQIIAYASAQGLRWLDTYITKLKGDAGLSRQVVWTAFDITATRHSYQELLKNHDALTQTLDEAPILFFQKDSSGRFQRANKAFCDYFNVRADVIFGRTDEEVFRESAPGFSQLTVHAMQNPGGQTEHHYAEKVGDTQRTVHWHALPIVQQGSNQIESLVGYGFTGSANISGEASTANETNTGNIALFGGDEEEMAALELTGAVGRDFKTILNSIVNYTEVALSQKNAAREQRIADHLQEVVRTASHAHELVEHKASRQQDKKPTAGTALQPLIKEIIDMMRPTMPASLNLKTEIDENAASALIAETPFKQIVMQLLVSARTTALAAQQRDSADGEDQEIVLSLSNGKLAKTGCSACTDELKGDYIVLAVHTKTAAVSSVDLQKLIKAAQSATRQNSASNVVAMAHNNNGHAVIEQQDNGLALQLLFKKA